MDALGRREKKTVNGTTTQFLYDGLNPVEELNRSNAVVATMLTGLNIDEYFTRTEPACCGPLSYLTDALGSTVALADSNGVIQDQYQYEPFGNTYPAYNNSSTNPYQFTGRENDGFGFLNPLYYYRGRYYSPTFQRFISQDPADFAGGDTNLYAYAVNSPTNFSDPSGLDIAVIEGGPTGLLQNPAGHTAIAITGYGTFSFGTGTTRGMSLAAYLRYQATYRSSTVFVIHTTRAQDIAALGSLRGQPHHMGPVSEDNCSTRTNQALDAAGIQQLNIPISPDTPSITIPLLNGGILPGSAGQRAYGSGATIYNIPEGSTQIPGALGQFEPIP